MDIGRNFMIVFGQKIHVGFVGIITIVVNLVIYKLFVVVVAIIIIAIVIYDGFN